MWRKPISKHFSFFNRKRHAQKVKSDAFVVFKPKDSNFSFPEAFTTLSKMDTDCFPLWQKHKSSLINVCMYSQLNKQSIISFLCAYSAVSVTICRERGAGSRITMVVFWRREEEEEEDEEEGGGVRAEGSRCM